MMPPVIIRTYLPIVTAIIGALILYFYAAFAWRGALLAVTTIIGLWPLTLQIIDQFKNKKFHLGTPVEGTILILIYLREFHVAAIFTLLILSGMMFVEYILWKIELSIKDLSRSLPDTAFIKQDPEIVTVKIAEVKIGDTLVVKDGGRMPVDGILLSQTALFDQSVVSGESKPVRITEGGKLLAGSINLSSYVEARATATNETSTVAQIRKMVGEAQSRSAPLSKFTTWYAEMTSLVTLFLVLAAYWYWNDTLKALAIWVALVPMMFAIIVPVGTTIGISLLAKRGVLVKNAEALENLSKIDTIVFDKTGTLTLGIPQIADIIVVPPFEYQEIVQLTASVEKYSEYRFAEPIVSKAQEEGVELLPVDNVKIAEGQGISARCNNQDMAIGNLQFMKNVGIEIPNNLLLDAEQKQRGGSSSIFVAQNRQLAGIFFLADQLREEAKPTLRDLKQAGCKLTMLTGDSKVVAESIAQELSILDVHAELLPEDKTDFIKKLKASGKKVIMVGDGLNDAPALAEANVGIALGLHGIDVTLESAEVILINDNLSVLLEIIRFSQKVFGIIRGDLYIATTIHIITAMLVVYDVIGVLGSTIIHQCSATTVLLNTMRIFYIDSGRKTGSSAYRSQNGVVAKKY